MLVSDVFNISCDPNDISTIVRVCQGEVIADCRGVAGWKIEHGTEALRRECASDCDLLTKLQRIRSLLNTFELSFGTTIVNKIRTSIPECLLQQCPNFLSELKDRLLHVSDTDQLSRLLNISKLSDHPAVLSTCDDIVKELISIKLSEAEGEHFERLLPDVIVSITATVNKLSKFVDHSWGHSTKIVQYAYTEFGKMRANELFSTLVKYPSSEPALLDLRDCLVQDSDLYSYLVESAKDQLQKRLLHPGAGTEDVIQLYIDVMKIVDLLFPGQHRAINSITGSIQSYARQRKDGPAIFILGLINDEQSQLASVLHPELREKRAELCDIEVDHIVEDGKGTHKSVRHLDVLKKLVQTFGGRDAVLGLYRSVLAERLLAKDTFEADTDLVALELLKIRFGEAALQNCEVMIKDLAESKRFAAKTAQHEKFTTLITSSHYWPRLPTTPGFEPHPVIAMRQELVGKDYATLKNPRQLAWQPGMGTVTLNISVFTKPDRSTKETMEVTAPMIQATLILYLVEVQPGGLSGDELAAKCGLTKSKATSSMTYWTLMSVVREENGTYFCNEFKSDPQQHHEGDTEHATTSVAEAEDEEVNEKISEFITMILHNLGPEDTVSIENKLRQFMPDYNKTQPQLVAILNKLVTTDQLTFQGGKYSKA
eukprot:TRINITY_DN11671_c1_g1_i1.p1 TRINITY_DN11671_c1_g1~~TRINITY_DN11671_c1_g1_i1.p1  ORF type:complete len:715 (+),score=112.22 TRINITY_DN11671_c1_g1_i1:181-2145(+)